MRISADHLLAFIGTLALLRPSGAQQSGIIPSVETFGVEDRVETFDDFAKPRRLKGRRQLKKSGGKGKGGSKSCKSSKKGDCDEDKSEQASCGELRGLVSELTTKVDGVGIEILRLNALADELGETTFVASGDNMARRKMQTTNIVEPPELSLADQVLELDTWRSILTTGNARVLQYNAVLRQSAMNWIGRNADLSKENEDLLKNLGLLKDENLSLQEEKDRLAEQIKDLGANVDDLNDLIGDQGDLNGDMNDATAELEAQIARLEAANAEYEKLNGELNDRIDDLEDQNDALAEQIEIFAGLNQDLNATAQKLEGEVDRLEGEVDELTLQNNRLDGLVGDLEDQTDRLEGVNLQLRQSVRALEDEVFRFENKVDELEALNQGLETIVSFVNETAGNLDETFESVTEYLADQIVAYRSLATETLQNTYLQRVSLWDCAYRDHFGDEAFAYNGNMEIPPEKFDDVVTYIDDRVLEELCLSETDFEQYLENVFNDPVFTSNHFISGINSYSLLALNYYFPDSGDVGGLTEQDWAEAGYQCERLPREKRFSYKNGPQA